MSNTLKYEQVTVEELIRGIREDRYALPRYQRGISWNEDQQKALITSIHQGFPIGALLWHLVESNPEGNKYTIVDGLQRTTALRNYMENQGAYVTQEALQVEWVNLYARNLANLHDFDIDVDRAREDLYRYLSGVKNFSQLQLLKLYQFLIQRYSLVIDLSETADLDERWGTFHDTISTGLNIANYPLPVIAYQGPSDLLPEIFGRLNSNVVKLNKYQIVAASWELPAQSTNVDVANEIAAYWHARLQELEGMPIEGIDDSGRPDQIYLFDYLIGLGRHLCKKFPLLFESGWGDTIAFQLATVAHGLRLSEMSVLERYFPKVMATDPHGAQVENLNCESFTKAIVSACEVLDSQLRPRIGLKLNSSQGVNDKHPGHTVLQIASMVVSLCVHLHDKTDNWKKFASSPVLGRIPRNIQDIYLLGRVDNYWSSSGDSKFFRAVWGDLDGGSYSPSDLVPAQLFPDVSQGQLNSALDAWFQSELQRRDKKRVSVNAETKTVLKYFYSKKTTYFDHFASEFHLDHVVPVSWWKKVLSHLTGVSGAPFNAIGNIALMTGEDNLSKGAKQPLTWKRERLTQLTGDEVAQFEEKCREDYFLAPDEMLGYSEEFDDLSRILPDDADAATMLLTGLREQSEQRWGVIKGAILEL